MTHTHKFEVELCDGTKFKGEMCFNSGCPGFKTDKAVEMDKRHSDNLNALFNTLVGIYNSCGEIEKIKINKNKKIKI